MIARLCLLPFLAWIAFAAVLPARAQDSLGIAAVVNGDVITALDVAMRTRMAIMSSSLKDSPEVRERLQPQVLRSLIDERLKLQEAERRGIKVADEEVSSAMESLAEQNNLSVEQFRQTLAQSGVYPESLEAQIRAETAWAKLARQRLRPTVQISDAEIDEELQRIRANQGKPEYLVAEIFLNVDSPSEEQGVRESAERLLDQIRGGADFRGVAQQFSQSASAGGGGIIGWVRQGQLEPKLDQALRSLAVGEVSPVIRTSGGFYILQVRDQRQTGAGTSQAGTVSMRQVYFGLPKNPTAQEIDKAEERAREVASNVNSCDEMTAAAAEAGPQPRQNLENVSLESLPATLRQVALNLDLNQPSPPLRLGNGVAILMVCAREAEQQGLPTRVEIANRLSRQRLELLARGYLRDLRRSAYVEMRN